MVFYWIIFIVILLVAVYSKNKKVAFYVASILLMFLGVTRARTVGNDLNGEYWAEYSYMGLNPDSWGSVMHQFEYGFSWLMANFKFRISKDPLIFFHVLFFVTFLNYLYFIFKESRYKWLSLFFMLAFAYYFQLYNGMRQEFCYSIILVFLSFFLLQRQKYLYFCLSVVVSAMLFHKSMLLMLLMVLLFKFYHKFSTKWLILLLLISSLASITLSKFAFDQMSAFAVFFDDGTSNFSNYMQDANQFGKFSQISNLLNTLFCIYTVYSHRHKQSFFLVCYVFGVILLNILTPINWIFQRIAYPFMFYRVITYADLWYKIPDKNERLLFRFSVILLSVIMFQNRLVSDNFKDVVPYVNVFFQ